MVSEMGSLASVSPHHSGFRPSHLVKLACRAKAASEPLFPAGFDLLRSKPARKEGGKRAADAAFVKLQEANRNAPQDYGQAVLQAISCINEAPINYALIEAAIVHIVNIEARGGPGALLEGWEGLDNSSAIGPEPLAGPGAILVFLPGAGEITRLQKILEASGALANALCGGRAHVLPLHGGLPPSQQGAAFKSYGPRGRKIVLATNVAETSVTIPDVTVVIDTGRMKEMQFDGDKGLVRLVDTWVSKASARQRRGRAGRVRCVSTAPIQANCHTMFLEAACDARMVVVDMGLMHIVLHHAAFHLHLQACEYSP
jgi:hypothetical protein